MGVVLETTNFAMVATVVILYVYFLVRVSCHAGLIECVVGSYNNSFT